MQTYKGEEWPPAPNVTQPLVPEPDLMPGKIAIGMAGIGWAVATVSIVLRWSPGALASFFFLVLPALGFLVGLAGGRTWTAILGRLMSLALIILYVLPQFVTK